MPKRARKEVSTGVEVQTLPAPATEADETPAPATEADETPAPATEADETPTAAVETQLTAALPLTVEDRLAILEAEFLARLEAALHEKNVEISRQAGAIAIANENAERMRTSRARVDQLAIEAERTKKTASEAKKRYEAEVLAHFELEEDLDSPQGRLPFPTVPEPGPTLPIPAPVPTVPEPVPTEPDDDWRSVPIGKLGIADELPGSIVERMAEAGIRTVGDLSDWIQNESGGTRRQLTDLPSIGPAKAERIETALDAFWLNRATPLPSMNDVILAGVEEVEAAREIDQTDEFPEEDEDGPDQTDESPEEDGLDWELDDEINLAARIPDDEEDEDL